MNLKQILKFLGKFLLYTILLTIIWYIISPYYLIFISWITKNITHLFNYNSTLNLSEIGITFQNSTFSIKNSAFNDYNFLPFFALLFATPLSKSNFFSQKLKYSLIGLFIFIIFHILYTFFDFVKYYRPETILATITTILFITRIFLPFIVWVIFCFPQIKKLFNIDDYFEKKA